MARTWLAVAVVGLGGCAPEPAGELVARDVPGELIGADASRIFLGQGWRDALEIWTIDKASGALTALPSLPNPSDMAWQIGERIEDEDAIYVRVTTWELPADVVRIAKADGAARVLYQHTATERAFSNFAIDEDSLYWEEGPRSAAGGRQLFRLAKAGGTAVALAANDDVRCTGASTIVLDGESLLYRAANGKIDRVPRHGGAVRGTPWAVPDGERCTRGVVAADTSSIYLGAPRGQGGPLEPILVVSRRGDTTHELDRDCAFAVRFEPGAMFAIGSLDRDLLRCPVDGAAAHLVGASQELFDDTHVYGRHGNQTSGGFDLRRFPKDGGGTYESPDLRGPFL